MRKSKTKFLILGLLTEGQLSGYEIKRIVDIRFNFFWNESYGQLYPHLKKMVQEGLITETESDEPSSRGKILYSITEAGREELKAWLKEPVEKESVRFELLLKMYFSNQIDSEVMKEHIKEFAEYHKKQLDILQLFNKELSSIEDPNVNHKDILQVISFGEKVYKAYVEWSEETIKYLKGRDNHETKN
jgi:DNA-binding PadR family transcriptional regulator